MHAATNGKNGKGKLTVGDMADKGQSATTTTLAAGIKTTVVPESLEAFLMQATMDGPLDLATVLGALDAQGNPLVTLRGRNFSTGSVGWIPEASGMIKAPWGENTVRLTMRGNVTCIGSKGSGAAAPADATHAQLLSALLGLEAQARSWGAKGKYGWMVQGKTTVAGALCQVGLFLAVG